MTDKPIDDGGPAFPVEVQYSRFGRFVQGRQTSAAHGWETGMSLRDWFAGQALEKANLDLTPADEDYDEIARVCYALADAMIAARSAKK